MSRYISVDDMRGIFCQSKSLTQAWNGFDMAPSIDIVRCKECKYWDRDRAKRNKIQFKGYCDIHSGYCDGDKYCTWGEVRDE